jgi:hypothetical protein
VQELQNGRNGSRVCMVREDLSTKDSGENSEQKVSKDNKGERAFLGQAAAEHSYTKAVLD